MLEQKERKIQGNSPTAPLLTYAVAYLFSNKLKFISKSAWPDKNGSRQRGETRIQGFSVTQWNVKSIEFREAGRP
ncbi:MAG: hypothetical protein V4506_10040, partial [Bacteroidota bacterium]